MKRKTKILGISAGCLGLLGLGSVLLVVGLFILGVLMGAYNDTPWDRARLRSIRDPYRDIPAAIETQHKVLGHYPKDLADFDSSLPGASDALRILNQHRLQYSAGDYSYFVLYQKLNWDGGLVYDSRNPKWLYDAGHGDGTGIWPID